VGLPDRKQADLPAPYFQFHIPMVVEADRIVVAAVVDLRVGSLPVVAAVVVCSKLRTELDLEGVGMMSRSLKDHLGLCWQLRIPMVVVDMLVVAVVDFRAGSQSVVAVGSELHMEADQGVVVLLGRKLVDHPDFHILMVEVDRIVVDLLEGSQSVVVAGSELHMEVDWAVIALLGRKLVDHLDFHILMVEVDRIVAVDLRVGRPLAVAVTPEDLHSSNNFAAALRQELGLVAVQVASGAMVALPGFVVGVAVVEV